VVDVFDLAMLEIVDKLDLLSVEIVIAVAGSDGLF
jgi:hypothetical protein